VAAAADSASGGSCDRQNRADNEQQDADHEENMGEGEGRDEAGQQKSEDDQDDAENDHDGAFLIWRRRRLTIASVGQMLDVC
jgi:hypothetical protein